MKNTIGFCRVLFACAVLSFTLSKAARASTIIDFSDLSPGPSSSSGSYWNGPDPNGTSGTLYTDPAVYGQFTSGGAAFQNVYAVDPTYGPYWEGFAYSNVVNTTTPDYTNQYASITGGGFNGGVNSPGSTYAVGYYDPYAPIIPTIILPAPATVLSADVTNTTYAYYSMLNGDGLGDLPFTTGDAFQLTIQGFDANDASTGSVVVDLASGTDILDSWMNVNLAGLGEVKSLQFSVAPTNPTDQPATPSYFALGDLTIVPEPSTLALLACGGIAIVVAARKQRMKNRVLR